MEATRRAARVARRVGFARRHCLFLLDFEMRRMIVYLLAASATRSVIVFPAGTWWLARGHSAVVAAPP